MLAATGELGLYRRNPEKKAGVKVLCAGSCKKTWPALAHPAGTKVASAVPGVKGTFETTKRPAALPM